MTYRRCRAAIVAGENFTMNECSVGQVMSIQSAEAGYNQSYYSRTSSTVEDSRYIGEIARTSSFSEVVFIQHASPK